MGTSLLLTQSENTEPTDPVFGHKVDSKVQFLDSTRKKLKLKRVFLKPKQPESNQKSDQSSSDAATSK